MKTTIKRMLAACSAAVLTLTGALTVSAAPGETDVIITLNPPADAAASVYAEECAEMVTERWNLRSDYIYDTLFCGFHLSVPEAMIPLLGSLDFVQSVEICGSYEPLGAISAGSSLAKASAAASEMIAHTADTEYTGDGIKVAVIDNGFYVDHAAFAGEVNNTLDIAAVGNPPLGKRLSVMRHVENASEFYHSPKIPFRFDYAESDTDVTAASDHGTHVAGIIGAMPVGKNGMQGIAPGCQLLLMKIFDNSNAASDHVLIAAMEDALKLGADIVNLSLGRYAGSANVSQVTGLDNILTKMQEAGCLVITASGNDGISTKYSSIAETSLPPASYTDFGTVSTPASSDIPIAVTSVDNRYNSLRYFRHLSAGMSITYEDTNQMSGVLKESFTSHFDGQTIEYAVVPGLGEDADYEGIDVTDKIALIRRGTTTFVEKVNTAAAHGAVGAIIYNNIEEDVLRLELTGAKIPAISISLAEGEALAGAEDRRIRFNSSFMLLRESETAGQISDSASRGATPSLTLKPDIAAVGSDVFSTFADGGYGILSGTSMATPQLTGTAVLMLEQQKKQGITGKDAAARIRTALMNTAVPIKEKSGADVSPRNQGAGLVNAAGALHAELALTYEVNGKPKAELYDLIGDFIYLDVRLANLTAAPLAVQIDASLATDGYTMIDIDEKPTAFNSMEAVSDPVSRIMAGEQNINCNADTYEPLSLTLAPEESRVVSLVIEFDEAYHDALDEIFTNGHFIDGFVYARTENGSYSLPYMGYKGDWTAAPVLDMPRDSDVLNIFGGTGFIADADQRVILLEKPENADAAFSPDGNGFADQLSLLTHYLRNTVSSKLTVTDEAGEVLYSKTYGTATKSNGIIAASGALGWNGGDGMKARYVFPDGTYHISITFTLDYRSELTQTYSYTILLDTVKPVLTDMTFDGTTLSIAAEDENGVKTIHICKDAAPDSFWKTVDGSTASFDLSEYDGETLYYEIIDHALNSRVGKVTLADLPAPAATEEPAA